MGYPGLSMLLLPVMVPFERLTTAREGVTLKQAYETLQQNRKGKLPIINERQELIALIARTDLKKVCRVDSSLIPFYSQARDFPLSSMDSKGRLLVGAATHTREGAREHIVQLAAAGVDVIVIVSIFPRASRFVNVVATLVPRPVNA